LKCNALILTALFSRNLKILQTSPTTKIQEAELVERPSDLRRGLQRREVGVVQAFPHLLISVKDDQTRRGDQSKKHRHRETCGPEEQSEQDNAYYIQSNYTAVYAVYEQYVQPNREC